MTRQTSFPPIKAGDTPRPKPAAKQPRGRIMRRDADFAVRIARAPQARPLLNALQAAYLQPDSLVFFLEERQAAAKAAPAGFCIVRRRDRRSSPSAARQPAGAADKFADKHLLEIALFHIAAGQLPSGAPAAKTARIKTRLLRAVAEYCRQQQIDYVFGQFSFQGKYPAAYAREFSCLYHYYRMKETLPAPKSGADKTVSMDIMPAEAVRPAKMRRFLPPLLHYCLRLGAKAGDRVAVDKNYNQGAGSMNILLLLPLSPFQANAPLAESG